jgi:hypothetical protein
LSTADADIEYGGGFETIFGYRLNCCYAIQAGYWGFFPEEQEAYACNDCFAGDLGSALRFYGLRYDNGQGYDGGLLDWYGDYGDPASAHRLRRNFEAHNIEVNLIRNPVRRSGCVHYELLGGVRFLTFDDSFSFATDYANDTFGDDPANELDYVIRAENNLIGFQLGGRMDYYIWHGLALNAGTKLGIYGNHIRHRQYIWGGNGFAYVDGTNELYNVHSSKDDVAFLGELQAGLSYDLGACWRVTGGYRAIIASGVALSTSQIPRENEYASKAAVGRIDSADSLVLHGAYLGVEYNW